MLASRVFLRRSQSKMTRGGRGEAKTSCNEPPARIHLVNKAGSPHRGTASSQNLGRPPGREIDEVGGHRKCMDAPRKRGLRRARELHSPK